MLELLTFATRRMSVVTLAARFAFYRGGLTDSTADCGLPAARRMGWRVSRCMCWRRSLGSALR
jgi:hypothetical protein